MTTTRGALAVTLTVASTVTLAGALGLAGCDDAATATDAGVDAGATFDAGSDAGATFDAGADAGSDAASDSDAGADAAAEPDAGADGGSPTDAGSDAGADLDAGTCEDPPPATDRPSAIACSSCRPDFAPPSGSSSGCTVHSDCTDGANGRCVLGMIGSFCTYDECFADSDCATDQVCECDGQVIGGGNACVDANCHTNADCTSGTCAPTYGCLLGAPPSGWYCRTSADTCGTDADCTGGAGGRCAFSSSLGHWQCEYGICVF